MLGNVIVRIIELLSDLEDVTILQVNNQKETKAQRISSQEALKKRIADTKHELEELEKKELNQLKKHDHEEYNAEEYWKFLLYSCSTDNKKISREIAKEENFNFLKKNFFPNFLSKEGEEKSREKHSECIYRLFMFFADTRFADERYSIEVLTWLATEKVEEVIERKDKVKMVHLLAAFNNLRGVKWAFERYRKYLRNEDIKKIFEILDEYKQDIFNYVANGIIATENSNLNSQAEIIGEILIEFGKTIIGDNKTKGREVNKKKDLMRSLLEKIELTEELEEQFAVDYTEKAYT